ncbi:MAG: hypothetical protein BGO95_08400 [Micrococcales bacterium 73-13]|nr:MAG: hypothetical protein BGO95_08400 [Micrococcales bacterium 73-13]
MSERISRILHPAVPGIADTVRVEGGTTIYVSGAVGVRPDGSPAADFAEECELAIASVERSLAGQGATLGDIVRLSVYVVGLDDEKMDVWHRVRDTRFDHADSPAGTLLGIGRLYSAAVSIEIEATAVL